MTPTSPSANRTENPFRLDGRTALIVGIGPAIGQAVAEAFADAGARTIITARRADAVEKLAASIRDKGGDCVGMRGDINDPLSRSELIELAGDADILFYNAYAIDAGETPTFELTSPLDASEADWEACFRTNMLAPFMLAKALVPAMIARGGGVVINCVAAAAFTPILPAVAYGATKAGLATMTKYLARACAPKVRFNAIAPSNIEVPGRPEELRKAVTSFPLGRMGLPEEVATTAVYLASDASSFVTGQIIHVDGGRVTTA
jgi:NAD(P)-dependent dehydrogenase (short-subunit alcohol dehydrogenase family)